MSNDSEPGLIADLVRVRAALQACWDEYHELMPDALYQQVKVALGVRVFTATPVELCPDCGIEVGESQGLAGP